MSIEIRNVSKRFGSFVALDDVSLEIPQGSLTAVLGPSGSGKSTLLRIVAGLERPDSGEVFLSGEDATGIAPQRRDVGFVFQHYAAFKHMTVRDNVAFALTIRKRPKQEIRERVDELLALVQLQGFADRYPSRLSGGQRQRMALARALAAKPRVLLLDEPFGALDARVRAELRDWLRRLHEEVHVTTVFVTHDQEEAMEVADRVAVMDHGRLEQVGAPAELYDEPASEFVLRFVGDAVRLGSSFVRPHEIVLKRWPGDGAVEVEVERIAVLGADARVELVEGNGERLMARLRRDELEDLDLTQGEILWATAEPFRRLAVDAEAGQPLGHLGRDVDALDLGASGAVPAEVDKSVDVGALALEDGLDSSVGTVAHPAGNTARPGGPLDGEAEADALDEAVHDDA
jgi:sulfate/thiosulfate transport system ATP-binding protein